MKTISKNMGGRSKGLALLFGCFATLGCGGHSEVDKDDGASCTSICKRSQACPDSGLVGQDCSDYCAKIEALNRNAGCTAEFDTIIGCAAAVRNFCQPPTDACRDESEDYAICYTAYCTDHAQECADAL